MPPSLPPYSLVETEAYQNGVRKIGSYERLDNALDGAMWALANNPKVYGIVEGTKDIRLLKTNEISGLPALRIWFRIDEDNKKVELLMIEAAHEENGNV